MKKWMDTELTDNGPQTLDAHFLSCRDAKIKYQIELMK